MCWSNKYYDSCAAYIEREITFLFSAWQISVYRKRNVPKSVLPPSGEHHFVHAEHDFFKGRLVVFLLKSLQTLKFIHEVVFDVNRHDLTPMAIENTIDAAAVGKVEVDDVGVFLLFAPTLHASHSVSHILIFIVFRVLFCDWFGKVSSHCARTLNITD